MTAQGTREYLLRVLVLLIKSFHFYKPSNISATKFSRFQFKKLGDFLVGDLVKLGTGRITVQVDLDI